MEKNSRYSGPPTTLYSYMREFSVECPKCKCEAIVTNDGTFRLDNGRLTCRNCTYSENASDLIRYKSIVKRYCDNCGKQFEAIYPSEKEPAPRITVPCPHCGTIQDYKPKIEKYKAGYKSPGAVDPVFNLPLWFQVEIKGNLMWAFNRSHLSEIKSYVNAKLRERQTWKHTTMVEKLPQFIKAAKNREMIIKVIDKLERKLSIL
jgi:hypothetical protein